MLQPARGFALCDPRAMIDLFAPTDLVFVAAARRQVSGGARLCDGVGDACRADGVQERRLFRP